MNFIEKCYSKYKDMMLYRKIEKEIEDHLKSDSDKILIIEGARQIGKSYMGHAKMSHVTRHIRKKWYIHTYIS